MSHVDWDLLFRYLGEECSVEERARVVAWLAEDERHSMILESAKVAGGRSLATLPVLSRGIVREEPRRVSMWVAAAAAGMVVVAGGALMLRAFNAPAPARVPSPVMHTATTGPRQRDTLRLEDGTRVVLGANSTLRYPVPFAGGSREVSLAGEGYFEVTHDTQHPFRVHAGHATAEDLGTSFGVRVNAADSSVQVVVADGMVALGGAKTPLARAAVLRRNELGMLANGSTVASVRQVNADVYLGWAKGRLVFDETPLSEVAAQLARWYGVEVRVTDTAHASRLSATFTNESLSEVLAALAPVLDVRFEREGNAVVIHPRDRGR
jgi:transmembrane sensor